MSNDDLTHENFDFRGFDVPDLKAVTLASSSDGDQSKQPKTKHEDASKNRKHGKKKSKSDARSKKRAGAGKTSESFDDYEDYEEREAVSKADKKVSKDRPGLFAPMTLREVTVRNRIWLPPMCTYSSFARDGRPTPFHYQHYVSRAFGGFGMVRRVRCLPSSSTMRGVRLRLVALPLVTTVRACRRRRAAGLPWHRLKSRSVGCVRRARCPWMRFMVWSARSPRRRAVRWPPASRRFRFMPRMAI